MSNRPSHADRLRVKKRIVERKPNGSAGEFSDECHPVIRRICAARNIQSAKDLDHSLKRLPDPGLFTGMATMVAHLMDAIERRDRVLIVADFDADGATSCAVAKRGLEMLGASEVLYSVPDRFKFGYGLTPEIVEVASLEKPQLILTVDNGISSLEGVKAARDRGIKVLITDHHLPGAELPDADAIVNPNLPGDPFPGKSLAGVGVMFYVLSALRKALRETGLFQRFSIPEPNLACLLDFVALGTVADVVELDHINRILVHQGLQRIRKGSAHPGIQAILQVTGRSVETLTASDLGFSVGPRLNAAGRLDNMALGIECLLAEEAEHALRIAEKLDSLNRDRREIENRMKNQALDLLNSRDFQDQAGLPAGICLHDESWHQGVVGIIASRIKDRVNRPVIAFASVGDGFIKGSARSVAGIHVRDVLSEIAALHPHLLSKFGGHAMAAGLSLRSSDFSEFSSVFADVVKRQGQDLDAEPVIYTDGSLNGTELTLEFAELLHRIAPWGRGFPEPLFQGDFEVVECRVLKEKHVKFDLCTPDLKQIFDAIAFFVEHPEGWLGVDKIRLVYRLAINQFRNFRKVQLMIEYMEALEMPD
ncbi:MAG: single-stranded-DNA-specific exonuclease RecJ [Methylococcaceae bacterium]|nr:single-stranded-DNA-specific exonuclease RecJ [Methylococcaceae bacterium]